MVEFSIIIPHYNISNLLSRCIQSIPNRNDLEIIVIDDKSIEEEFNKAKQICKDRGCLFYENNLEKSAGTCRNIGLKKSRGRWIIFADADDFFNTTSFNTFLDKYQDSIYDIIYFNIDSVYSEDITKKTFRANDKNKLFDVYNKVENKSEVLDYFRFSYPEPWGKMVKYYVLKLNNIQFDSTPVCNDFMFSFKAGLYATRIKVVNEILYVLTLRPDSLSNHYFDKYEKLYTRIYVLVRVMKLATLNNVSHKYLPVKLGDLLYLVFKYHNNHFYTTCDFLKTNYGYSKIKLYFLIFSSIIYKLKSKFYGCIHYNH